VILFNNTAVWFIWTSRCVQAMFYTLLISIIFLVLAQMLIRKPIKMPIVILWNFQT